MHNHNNHGHRFTLGIELTPDIPVHEARNLGIKAEEAGIEAVFVSNHYDNRDPVVVLTALASNTADILIGTGVVNPYTIHPVRLATQVATLAEWSDGRAIFGIGAGDGSTLAKLGLAHDRPVSRVAETAEVARELFAGKTVGHDGTFSVNAASLGVPANTIPVYVGAQGPDMLQMAGAKAEGVLVNAAHPADCEAAKRRIRTDAGRRDPQIVAFASVSVSPDRDAARAAARPPVAFVAAGAPDAVLDRHDIDRERVQDIGDALERGDHREAYDRVSEQMLEAFAIVGDPAEVRGQFNDLATTVDGVVAASPLGPDRAVAIERLGEMHSALTPEVI